MTEQTPTPSTAEFRLREDAYTRSGWCFSERPGLTPFGETGPWTDCASPGHFSQVRAWLDEQGAPWIAHDCANGRECHRLPSQWQVIDGGRIEPSYSCDGCGLHDFATIDCSLRR